MNELPPQELGAPVATLGEQDVRNLAIQLQHSQLVLRDELLGARQEVARLRELLEDGAVEGNSGRLEAGWVLAEQRENELNTIRHESGQALARQNAELRANIRWRIGAALLRPLDLIRGRRR